MPTHSKWDSYLLVEGQNDKHVVWALCQSHNIPQSFEVRGPQQFQQSSGGISQLLDTLRLILKSSSSDLKTVGIIVDADQNLESRWQQITDLILQHSTDYNFPSNPTQGGTVIESNIDHLPRLGIWIMPNNQLDGDLERFLRFLIPENDALLPIAEETLGKIEEAGLNLYQHKHHKALIHTWLAWQDEPGRPMGQSITAKALSADSPLALDFVSWLNQLFNPES